MGKRRATSREQLLEAAVRLFERKGYQNATMDDLAAALGIAKPTIYQYVRTKGALLEGISESLLARLKENLDQTAGIENPEERVEQLVLLFIRAVHELRPYFLIFFGEERELPTRTRKRFRTWARGMTDEVADIFRKGQKEGVLDPEANPQMAAHLLIGMLTSLARWYDPKGKLGPEDVSREVLGMLRGFYRPRERRRKTSAA